MNDRQQPSATANDLMCLTLDSIPQIIWVAGADCSSPYLNTAFHRYSQSVPGHSLAPDWQQIVHPDDLALSSSIWTHSTPDQPFEIQCRLRRHDGVYRWHLVRVHADRGEDGSIVRWVGVCTDIEDLKRTKSDLKLFRTLIDQMTDCVEVIDPVSGHYLDVNDRACIAHGFSREEFLKMSVADVDPLVARATWQQRFSELRSSLNQSFETLHKRRDGTTFPVEVNLNLVDLDREYLVAVVRDISLRKQMEEKLRQAQKMEAVGRLAAGVAHDFNNLLTVVNGYSVMLLRSSTLPVLHREMIEEIREAGTRATRLTNQLLTFSRQQIVAPQVLNFNLIIHNTELMLRRLIGEDVQLTVQLDPGLWAIQADVGQLEQVLLNLCLNARDAMPDGGQLIVETQNVVRHEDSTYSPAESSAPTHALLKVADTGHGMSNEVRQRIFEPFFSTKSLGRGTGLGLSTVYEIVKSIKGSIEVESEAGRGTTFKIYVPTVSSRELETETDRSETPALIPGTETVLLVEDDEIVRAVTKQILDECGYTVVEACNGTQALKLLASYPEPVHILITDVVMPDMPGNIVVEKISAKFPDLPVLYMSGYTEDAIFRHGFSRDQANFLQKPFSPFQLATKIRAVLANNKQPSR